MLHVQSRMAGSLNLFLFFLVTVRLIESQPSAMWQWGGNIENRKLVLKSHTLHVAMPNFRGGREINPTMTLELGKLKILTTTLVNTICLNPQGSILTTEIIISVLKRCFEF